jgi:hypothetical protein
MDPWCNGLPGGIGNSITALSPEGWSLVSAEDPGSKENLCDGLELYPPWTRDFLDPVPGSGGDAQVLQQSPKSASEDGRFSPEGLYLVSISVHLLIFGIAQGRVLFIGLVFCVMVLWLLLLLSRRVLSRWALRNQQLYLERFLFWWCLLWYVGLGLLRLRHILRCQLTDG